MDNLEKEYTKMHKEADVYTDTAADYSLPDYNGDIKKVLYTAATVLPAAGYNDGDSVSCAGVVSYDMIYLNSENELDRINFTSEYDVNSRIKADEILDFDITTRVANLSHRLFGPRRVNMKATLQSEIRCVEKATAVGGMDILENSDAECIVKYIDIATNRFAHSGEREYAECIARLDEVLPEEIEVLHTSSCYKIDDIKCEQDGALVRGEILVSAVVRCEGEAPTLYKKEIPFEEFVEAENIAEYKTVLAAVNVSSLVAETILTEEGAAVNVSLICNYSLSASTNKELSFVKDAFLKSCGCEAHYESISYNTVLGNERRTLTKSHTMPISDLTDAAVRSVVYMAANARVSGILIEEDFATVGVDIKLNGICTSVDNEGELGYFAVKTSCEQSEKVNFGCQIPENTVVECRARVIDCVAYVDEENLYIDVTYELSADATASKSTSYVSELHAIEGKEFKKKAACITVYYPTAEESLFDVARAYHTSVREIAEANMLSESAVNSFDTSDSLAGVKKLIIK